MGIGVECRASNFWLVSRLRVASYCSLGWLRLLGPADNSDDAPGDVLFVALLVLKLDPAGFEQLSDRLLVGAAHLLDDLLHLIGGTGAQRLQHLLEDARFVLRLHRAPQRLKCHLEVKLHRKLVNLVH